MKVRIKFETGFGLGERHSYEDCTGELSLPRVFRAEARLRFFITTSIPEPLRRLFVSAQYCPPDYQKLLRQRGFKVSISGTGTCHN